MPTHRPGAVLFWVMARRAAL